MTDDQNEPGGSRGRLNLDPLDLDRGRSGFTSQDESVAAAFRSSPRPDKAQTQGLLARLPEIQRRARRSYRRRQMAGSALLAAVAATSAILLVGPPGGRGSAAVTPANTGTTQPTATPVTRDSLLRTSQISAFGPGKMRQSTPSTSLTGRTLTKGICVDGTPWAAVPDRGWQPAIERAPGFAEFVAARATPMLAMARGLGIAPATVRSSAARGLLALRKAGLFETEPDAVSRPGGAA